MTHIPTSPELSLHPFPWYRQMRASMPIAYDEYQRGFGVFRYADVQRVLSEFSTFSSMRGPRKLQGESPRHPLGVSLINLDPPRHRQMRNLVNQAFTPRAVAQLEPRISQITHHLLDQVVAAGQMDIIDDLAYPLPVIVIAELLGIPTEDREQFKRWSDAVVTTGTGGMLTNSGQFTAKPEHLEMGSYFLRIIEQRRRQPGDDLISGLLAAEINGERLSEMELLGFCMLLLVAGNETTTNLLGNAILCFDEHPHVYERLRAHPDLLPNAIEEVLRYRSPVQSMNRVAIVDTEIGGQSIPAGSRVIAWIGSANRDEAQFPDPDYFDIARTPNRHLAFGHGIHFCLGAPLARLEAKIALGAILERLRNIHRRHDIPLEPLRSFIVYGVKHLPITFQPAW